MNLDFEKQENMRRRREQVYAAEMNRLCGDAVYTPEEAEEKMEAVFRTCRSI